MDLKLIVIIVAGITIEWCEYALYLYLGYILSSHFFPNQTPEISILLSFSVFATGYIFRPLGAYLYGSYSDKHGRKPPVFISILCIGLATAGIGLIPAYSQIGIWAPICLVALRIIQSLSIAGEFNNTAIYLAELTPHRKTLASALVGAAASFGMFIGGSLAVFLKSSPETMSWHSAFIILGIISLIVCLFRRRLQESPLFIQLQNNNQLSNNPLREAVSRYKLQLVKVFFLAAFVCVYVYTCGGFFAVYLSKVTVINPQRAMLYCSFSQLAIAILMPLIAIRFEKQHLALLKYGVAGFIVVAPAMFYFAASAQHGLLILLLIGYATCNALCSVGVFRSLYNILPTSVRCTGVSLFYNIAAALFGGTAPMLAQYFVHHQATLLPGFYVATMGVLAIFVLTQKHEVFEDEIYFNS